MNHASPEYKKYIASPRWKAKTEAYWMIYGRMCQICGRKSELQVHHVSYDHFGAEPMADLMGVCKKCHQGIHEKHRLGRGKQSLRDATQQYVKERRASKRPPRR